MKNLLTVIFVVLFLSRHAEAGKNRAIEPLADSAGTASHLSTDSPEAFERFQKRLAFLENYFLGWSSARFDTSLSFKVIRTRENGLGLSAGDLSTIPAGADPIEAQIRRRNFGTSSTFNLGALLAQGAKAAAGRSGERRQRRLRIIPSENEIRILQTLWAEKKATGAEVYRHLDSVRVTAAGLEEILADMTDRGMLTRQQVSPRHEFTIATPFGAIPLEMSGLNRKNREYVYAPTLSAEEVWAHIDASLFNLLSISGGGNESVLARHLRQLMLIMATPAK